MIQETISKSTDDMDEQFINEYIDAAIEGNFETFAENWGLSVDEAHKTALRFSPLEEYIPEGTTLSETDSTDTFTKNGVTIDTSGDIDATLLGMVGPGGKAKAIKGMLSGAKNLMSTKGGKASDLLMKPPGIGKEAAKKVTKPAQAASEKAMQKQLVKAAIPAATAIGLSGNRNKDGDFVSALNEDTPREVIDLGQPDGVEPLPDTEETMGNQYGYHKKKGQNFWTVNNDDPYWDTHEMGTGDAWTEAELKKAPAKELDWSSWFN